MRSMLAAAAGIVAIGLGSLLVFGSDFRAPALPRISPATAADLKNATAQEGYRTVTLRVENMTCASCPFIVRRSLENVDGVGSAKVSFREKTALITYDPTKCAATDLVRATANHGFPSSVIR